MGALKSSIPPDRKVNGAQEEANEFRNRLSSMKDEQNQQLAAKDEQIQAKEREVEELKQQLDALTQEFSGMLSDALTAIYRQMGHPDAEVRARQSVAEMRS